MAYGTTELNRSIVTAMVGEGGNLLLLMSDESVVSAGNVVGPAGEKGDRGMPGVKGDRGDDGNTVLTTDGPPQPNDGALGDWAIDKRGLMLYGPKTSAGWGKGNPMTLTDTALDSAVKRFNSKGGPGGGRLYGMGAPSAGIAPGPQQAAGLKPILGNNAPAPKAPTVVTVASEPDTFVFHVLLYAEAAAGAWYGEIVVARFGNTTSFDVAWEMSMGVAPVLTFSAAVSGLALTLSYTSTLPITVARGGVNLI